MKWWLKKFLFSIKLSAQESYQNEAESLVIWYAIAYAMGMAFYFAFLWEIPVWIILIYFEAILLLLFIYRKHEVIFKPLTYLLIFMLGLCVAKADALHRRKQIEENVPEIMYLNGYIEDISQNQNGIKMILSNVHNFDNNLKGKFRISTKQKADWLKQGICVEMIVKLPRQTSKNPLSNYDFERVDFYNQISAGGYVISPVFETNCESFQKIPRHLISDLQQQYLNTILKYADESSRGIISALSLGDKRFIDDGLYKDYRTAGLAHLLAISGMHMGMIALLIFFLIRVLLLPFGAGGFDLRKPAAVIALFSAYGYLLISGQSVSALRAFIMTSIILLAVLVNRRPISLRLWAFALIIVVTLKPVAVVSAGFLMSFAAVLGITSFYEKYGESISLWFNKQKIFGKISAYFLGVMITDFIASLMTLPYSIYYFHQYSLYTTLANLLAAPVVAFLVMPSLLLFLMLGASSLAYYAVKPLMYGVNILNDIAVWVAHLSGAHIGEGLAQMPDWGILLISLGILWLCIWQERWRIWGIYLIILGSLGFIFAPRADFVFDEKGTTFACRGENNKLIITPWHKNRFLTKLWTNGETKEDKYLICSKKTCYCQKNIRFHKGLVNFNGKDIALHTSGFIDVDRGVFYSSVSHKRIWNKQTP